MSLKTDELSTGVGYCVEHISKKDSQSTGLLRHHLRADQLPTPRGTCLFPKPRGRCPTPELDGSVCWQVLCVQLEGSGEGTGAERGRGW